ncbi:hypothetical protein NGM10_14790 [Halorussus salilacus]|uniref:hypothetical protein n=1 Tax=Halorussus salilacus TaxID=2953750 RepID=UPI00209C8089|nr:hypothetical protein [Halorussus salilacus]USZ67988.1 hypothetical protein NGM10_14790 [Halorussus salilacus]
MPGTPDPVVGSDAATFAVACGVGALAASLPYAFRGRLAAPRRVALGGGVASAALGLGAWAGARFATNSFAPSLLGSPEHFLGLLAWSALVLGAQAGLALYLFARWGLAVPLAELLAGTTLVLYAFLRVRGESDPLALYALFFGPLFVAGMLAASLAELGVRRAVARARG